MDLQNTQTLTTKTSPREGVRSYVKKVKTVAQRKLEFLELARKIRKNHPDMMTNEQYNRDYFDKNGLPI